MMSNMSHCRFQNTLPDLIDCRDALDDLCGDHSELSEGERRAAKRLIEVCRQIINSEDDPT